MTYRALYTLGYATWTLEALYHTVTDLDAVLVDVRLTAWSRKPGFMRRDLAKMLGDRYRHNPAFGNVNYNKPGQPIRLRHPELGLTGVEPLLKERPVILMCGCKDLKACHRLTVANYVAGALEVQVEHLEPPGKTE